MRFCSGVMTSKYMQDNVDVHNFEVKADDHIVATKEILYSQINCYVQYVSNNMVNQVFGMSNQHTYKIFFPKVFDGNDVLIKTHHHVVWNDNGIQRKLHISDVRNFDSHIEADADEVNF